MKPLSTEEIINYYYGIPRFIGCFPNDGLPKKLPVNKGLIMNLHTADKDGSHWVCLYRDKQCYYFYDSYGVPPTDSILKLKGKAKCCYNNTQLQPLESIACGTHCIYILDKMFSGVSFLNAVYSLDIDPQKNDKILENYYNTHIKNKI